MGRVKQKSAFEHVQNMKIQIILRLCKISSGPLLSILQSVVSTSRKHAYIILTT